MVKEFTNDDVKQKEINIKVSLQEGIVAPNNYSFVVAAFIPNHKVIDVVENICRITIIDSGTELSKFEGIDYGHVVVKSKWQL